MSEARVEIPASGALPSAAVAHFDRAGIISFSAALVLIGAVMLGLFFSILKLNGGTFIYTADDPYIALALSDQVRHGNYGINSGQHASPCSAILPPLLLVAASGTPLHPYLPLILNCLGLFATLLIVWRFLLHLRLVEGTFGRVAESITVLLLAFCFNLVGVVFTGLEQSLHVAIIAACIYGLALFLDTGKMPAWLPAAIVVSPLMRYEGICLSIAVLAVLALRGRWRTAVGTFVVMALCLGAFSAFLVFLKLPPLPSSVLTKSAVAANGVGGAGARFIQAMASNALDIALHRIGFLLLVIGVAAVVRCFRELAANHWHWTSQGLMAFALACMVGGHVAAGRIGGFDRYEDYALLGAALMGIYLMQGTIRKALANRSRRLIYFLAAAAALLLVCSHYVISNWKAPIAANNIYEQQFQMHRFVNDYYRGSVAVNDLGLISYHNPYFVLDLGGLASNEGRILFTTASSPDAYRALVDKNGVHLVIIFDEWFVHKIPATWVKVASMDQSRECVNCAEKEVQFYATDANTADKLRPELESFKQSLPPRVKLTIYSPRADAVHQATISNSF
ncbi:MAG: hypothetical protein ABR956_06680 [Terracidiphilus sp.]|jgi:hypothetical protein